MNRLFVVVFILLVLCSCGDDRKSLSDEQISSVGEFVESFPDIRLPLLLHDTSLLKKPGDSLRIAQKLVVQFIPDTVYSSTFKGQKPLFYAVGKATDANGDFYVVVKAYSSSRQVAYVLCFDKEKNFKAGMPLLGHVKQKGIGYEGGIDRKFIIYRNSYRRAKDGQLFYNRNAFVYNNVGTFTFIMKESNDIPEEEVVYNPIDTLPITMKFTGDYIQNKKNFVSVRDGAKPGRVLFFIHFEKPGGCEGELKGEAVVVDGKTARYAASGDPCSLELVFQSNHVQLKELRGCGNYRGIKCFFDGQYPKHQTKRTKK